MKKRFLLVLVLLTTYSVLFAQTNADSVDLEKLRRESGVDPTRVQSRAGYTFLMFDREGSAGQINNRLSLNLGVNRWNFSMKYDVISLSTGEPGSGFKFGHGRYQVFDTECILCRRKSCCRGIRGIFHANRQARIWEPVFFSYPGHNLFLYDQPFFISGFSATIYFSTAEGSTLSGFECAHHTFFPGEIYKDRLLFCT